MISATFLNYLKFKNFTYVADDEPVLSVQTLIPLGKVVISAAKKL